MNRYKVALVVDHFLPRLGGIELHVADLARQLALAGHQVQVVTTTPGELRIDGLSVCRLKASLLPRGRVLWNAAPLRSLRMLLERERFDVVHSHSSVVSPLAYAALYFCARLEVPCVLTTHSLLSKSADVLRTLSYFCKWADWPTRLTAVSRYTASRLARAAGCDDVTILPNGIDAAEWDVTPVPGPDLRMTSVMRLFAKKRPQDLVRSIGEIRRRLPAVLRPRLTLIGDGPARPGLERMARRLGVSAHVEFLGTLSRKAIREVFQTTDLFVLPTRVEAFGIAVLEARCAGLPVVAMNHCGVSDLIEHGRQGLLADSHEQFVDQIVDLLQQADLRRQMSRNTKQGLEQFGWSQVVRRHIEVYAEAIAAQWSQQHQLSPAFTMSR